MMSKHREFFYSINWNWLRIDKQVLLELDSDNPDIIESRDRLVHLIDGLQDHATDVLKISEDLIFPGMSHRTMGSVEMHNLAILIESYEDFMENVDSSDADKVTASITMEGYNENDIDLNLLVTIDKSGCVFESRQASIPRKLLKVTTKDFDPVAVIERAKDI